MGCVAVHALVLFVVLAVTLNRAALNICCSLRCLGLIEAKDEARGVTGVVQTKYYVLAHYSRHIRPGFKIISVVADQKDADYSTVAAFDNATSTVVIVSGNTGNSDVERSFDLSKFRSAGLAPLNVSNWQTQINGADRYARKVRARCFRFRFLSFLRIQQRH